MTEPRTPVTAASTIGRWLEHPDGGPALREMLAKAGLDAGVLAPVSSLPLQQLVKLSQGALSQDVLEDLVRKANGGVLPQEVEEEASWTERIVPGRFEGRTVIVTGAGSGIGRATAGRIAREGGRVIAVDVAGDRLADLAAEQNSVTTVTADLTVAADIDLIIAAAGDRIDGLANVAGIMDDASAIHEVSDAMWERVFAVNVDGVFRLTRAVLPAMLAAGRGSIVNVASEAALRGSAAGVAYTASKHAVVGITRSSAFMYGPSGIRVNAVAPGGVATGMTRNGSSQFGEQRTNQVLSVIPPLATAPQLAASITFLLSDDGVNVSGAILPSDGGWSAL